MVTTHLTVRRLHAVSPGSADEASRALRVSRDRIDVIVRGRAIRPSPSDAPRSRAVMRRSLALPNDAFLVLAVGRHDHLKAHAELVVAFDALAERMPSAWLVIAGREGRASARLRDALATHPLAARRTLVLGHRDDVRDLMLAADVLAISSVLEGTAGVAIEAMAEGLPVVATESAGVRGVLVDDVNCLLAPIGDAQIFAQQLERIATEPGLRARLSETGRARAAEEFSLDVAADAMVAWYRGLLDDAGADR
jgi:glycosyltransferase involved in cell wall biosynthesis